MINKTCKQCEYFVQHYAYYSNRYNTVHYGHCTHRAHKLGSKRPDTAACDDFVQCEPMPVERNEELIATVKRLREMLDKEFPPDP